MQALEAALSQEPVFLVLDNVRHDRAAAVLPFLAPRAPGSLLLATSWHERTFAALSRAQIGQGQMQPTTWHLLPMAPALVLQPQQAAQLMQQQIQLSRHVDSMHPLSDEQLTALASTAAAALAFSSTPAYIPKVLSVCACTLARMAPDQGVLRSLIEQLRAAKEPSLPGDLQPSTDDAVFSQLTACYEQLRPVAQQVFLDIARGLQLCSLFGLSRLSLWVSCRQQPAFTMEQARDEVRSMQPCLELRCCSSASEGHAFPDLRPAEQRIPGPASLRLPGRVPQQLQARQAA